MVSISGMIKLTSSNYSMWKSRMEDILYCKDLYKPIEEENKPENKTEDAWKLDNRKAVGLIRQHIDQSIFQHVANDTNAYKLWKKLESMYERKTALNKATLVRRLVRLLYKEGKNMAEHMNEFQGIVNQLTNVSMTIEDEVQALLLLSSLPDSWETLVISLSNSAPNGKLTLDMVKDSLFNEEARRKEFASTNNQTEAHIVESRGRPIFRSSQSQDKSRGRSKSKKRFTCFYCHKAGHKQSECRIWKRDMRSKNDKSSDNEDKKNVMATAVGDEVYFVGDDSCYNLTNEDCSWVIDTGASYHLTANKDYFTSYTSGNLGFVRMGNNGSSKIIGIGDVCLETNTGCKLTLHDVRHVPDIRLNLISAGKLDDEGYANHFSNGKWKLSKGSLIVAHGKKQQTLYVTSGKLSSQLNVAEECSTELWHKRLGHMSEKGLQILTRKQLLPLKDVNLKSCVDCLAGKQHRVSFRRNPPSRRPRVLDLVHTDVCSMTEKSLGGASYFVTFIDDHSRKVWVFLLKSKDQVFDAFKEFHAKVEREIGMKLKCVRSDNGGEYRGPFEEYCRKYGIKLEKTVPKTPQQNGLAERMNRTITEKVRSMLSHAKLPKSFWRKAVKTPVHLINLSPSVPLDGDVP